MKQKSTTKSGKIHVYTGNGKGKTTAGLGLALRAIGAGKRAAIIFFDKGGGGYSERKTLKFLQAHLPKHSAEFGKRDLVKSRKKNQLGSIQYYSFGLNRRTKDGQFRFGVTEQDREEGKRGLEKTRDIFFKKNCDVLILDEINSSLHLGIVSLDDFLELLPKKPESMELVLTGRNAPKELTKLADLVTEMKLKKHYFYSGMKTRRGVEY